MKLITVSESIRFEGVTKDFLRFVNEAGPQTFTPSNEKIIRCIEKRRYAGIYYEEESNLEVLSGFRLIEPLCFGRGYRSPVDGRVTHSQEFYLRAFVIRESKKAENKNIRKLNRRSVSKTQRVPYFRLFKLGRITMWEELRFKIPNQRELYNPNDEMIAEILQAANFD